jgi:general secretion pathway protein N
MMDVRIARLITLALASACGLLAVTAMVQLAGYGRGYGWLAPDPEPGPAIAGEIDRNPFALPPLSSFREVDGRPLFNDDRKPTPVSEGDVADEGPAPVPLNVTLTGVILVRKTETTPELRMAMVRDNMRNESVALKVGMPLTGDQAGWTLVALAPRLATFRNATDETAEIELYTAAAPPPPKVQRPPPLAPSAPGALAPGKNNNAAESDLARRIEERRRQMREEAERLRAQRNNSPNDQKN